MKVLGNRFSAVIGTLLGTLALCASAQTPPAPLLTPKPAPAIAARPLVKQGVALPAGAYVLSMSLTGGKFDAPVTLSRNGGGVEFALGDFATVSGQLDASGGLNLDLRMGADSLHLSGSAQPTGARGEVTLPGAQKPVGTFQLAASDGRTQRTIFHATMKPIIVSTMGGGCKECGKDKGKGTKKP